MPSMRYSPGTQVLGRVRTLDFIALGSRIPLALPGRKPDFGAPIWLARGAMIPQVITYRTTLFRLNGFGRTS